MIIKTIVLCDDRYRFLTSGFRASVCVRACAFFCARLSRTTGTDYRQVAFPLHTTKPALLSTGSTAQTVLRSFPQSGTRCFSERTRRARILWFIASKWKNKIKNTHSRGSVGDPPDVKPLSKAGCANVKPWPIVVVSIRSMFR